MSASREKKNRQEVAASGVADPKTARQAQEQAKERRSNRLYAIIAIAFVVVAIGLVVWNSNIIQRGTTAVTVEGESYSAAEVSYYYHNAYNSIVNSKYASLYGIDKNTSLSQQSLNDTAKMMLRVSEDMTWDAYFRDAAKKSLIQLTMLKKGAAEKGMTFNDDMQKEIDSTLETFSTYAKKAGYSTSAYLKLMYGNNMTMSTFKSILKDTVLASHYQQDYIDSLTYTDEEVETYYNEHKNNFDVADYEYIYFKGTADSTKDADGNTRELHTELAKGAIDYTVLPDYRTHYQKAQDREVELVSCPYFTTSLYDLTQAQTIDYSALDSFVVVICVEGKGTLCDDSGNEMPIHQGETVLLPATVKSLRVIPGGNLKMLTSYIK